MTFGEFTAWLEGFKASFWDGVPNQEQFAAIEAKLKLVSKNDKLIVPWPFDRWGEKLADPAHDGDAYGGRFVDPLGPHLKDVDA